MAEGERISADRFHVSKTNVNYGEPFGETEQDQKLIANLRRGKIVQKFIARPEGDGYGVVVGRRRFLAKLAVDIKHFTVGVDCLIEDMTDEEAREASWTENLDALRKGMNPIKRAEGLSKILASSTMTLRSYARRTGIPASNLSEWLKVLELSEKMQQCVSKGLLKYTDAMRLARLKLGEELQNELAELLEAEGPEAMWSEIQRRKGVLKRGIPKGMFEITRLSWDKRNRQVMGYYETIEKAAKSKKMTVPEFIMAFLISRMGEIEQGLA